KDLPNPSQGHYNGLPHEGKGPPRCNAKNRRGVQCKNPSIAPTTKCRFHGGLSLRGMAAPQYKNGMHSKYLPKHLKEDYEAALADPDMLYLKSQVALLGTRE